MMEKNQKKSRLLTAGGIGLAVVILIIILLLTRCGGITASVSPSQLASLLAEDGVQTIEVNSDIYIDEPLVVNGDKTIIGDGRIILNTALEGEWPDTDQPTWGMGCAAQNPEDGMKMPAVLNVSSGATLNLSDGIIVDAQGNGNGVLLNEKAQMKISGNAGIQNGRYANLVIGKDADVRMEGGQLLDGNAYNILNYGKLRLADGTVSGAKAGSTVYTSGSFAQQGGTLSGANFHNVYVAGGDFIMTGGLNEKAAKDGILVAKGGNAEVTGGSITACIHGLCNDGETTVGNVTLNECGIMNYANGTLDMKGTTVDTSEVYCLSNNGGIVNAEDFTAIGCDTCAIYNFSGDMNLVNVNVNGSRDGNVANAGGNLTIDGGVLDVCRDKSLVVGNGKVEVSDVTFKGTTSEKYGIYAYGGETYIHDCAIENVSSTAVKLDAGSYVELNNVSIKDVEQNAFQNDGGKLVANGVTVENANSHCIYNNGGEIVVDGLEVSGVKKNAIQHKSGTTSVSGMDASDIGNHGAYVEKGELTVEMSSFDDMAGNGFYIVEGDNKLVLKGVIITNAVQQGINNSSKVEGNNITISNTGKNGIYNKTGGSVSVSGLKITDVAEHGINNKAYLSASYVTVVNTGKDSNGIQNNGTMALSGASVTNSKNHGIYNGGTLNAYDVKVNGTKENGVYNDQGEAVITGLSISDTGAQGVNNNASLELENVKITKAGKNGIYNKVGGSMTVKTLDVDGTGEHGVSNDASMKLSNATIANTGDTKNGIQNIGVMTVNSVKITKSKNHGVYNTGSITGAGLTATNVAGNGIYNYKEAVFQVAGVTVIGAKDQGINNNGSLTVSNVSISDTDKNGIYNNGGNAVINGLTVSGTGEHGVSNNPAENGSGVDAVMTLTNATVNGSGAVKTDSNCIQNKGTLTMENVTLNNSRNHGIYNDGTITSKGTLAISNSSVNGIYNYGGNVDIASLKIDRTLGGNADSHGVNNTGVMTIGAATISNAFANGIQNSSGTVNVSNASITGSGKHGIYNGNIFNGKSIAVIGAGDLLMSNIGDIVIDGLTLTGSAHKALYNTGYAELYDTTVNGAAISNGGTAEYLLDNNGGILDLTDATLVDANGTALHNRGNAFSAVTNVIIDGAGNYGIFVEAGSTLSGDGLVVNNITKKITGAEGYAIKNAGKITMMDHVTLGDYDDAVTGDGRTPRKETSGIVSTAFTNDAATASYSGYDLTIKNSKNAAVYNKGLVYVTDLALDNNKTGVYGRYNSWVTLAGNVSITNTATNPFRLDGAESGNYQNGVTLASGTNVTIENCGSHAISNKGTFNAAADTTVNIKNVVGQNVNAVNNNGGTMTLGNVNIDGVYVTISMYNETTINSNSGNGIQTNNTLVLNGNAVIQNIYAKAANGKTDNSNSAGVVVKGKGAITGTGSITVIGNQTAPAGYEGYTGLHNGVFVDACKLEIGGDIAVSNTRNQGIYIANAKASLKANNVSISNAGANGLYVNNKDGAMELAGNVTIDGAGQNGLFNVSNNAKIHGAVSVSNINGGHNGIRNDGSGVLTVDKDITVSGISGKTTGTGRGNAIATNGKIYAKGNVTISGVTASGNTDNSSNNAIYGKGLLDVLGNVTITDKVAAGHGIFLDQGKLLADGNIEVNGTGSGKQGIYAANETITDGVVTKTAEVEGANITVKDAGGNGVYVRHASNKLTATGTVTVINAGQHGVNNGGSISAAAIAIDTVGNNGINNNGGTMNVTGAITVANPVGHGVSNNKVLNAAAVTVTNVTGSGNGIQNSGNGEMTVTGAVTIDKVAAGHGIYNAKTVNYGSFSAANVAKNGINNGGSFTVSGNVSVTNAVQAGVASNKTFTAGSITVDTVTAGPGVNNSGTMTVTGLTSVKNITGSNISAIQNKNTMTLGDVLVDGVNVTVGTDTEGNDMTNVGNGINNEKNLTVNGTATITNVFTDKKGNTIGTGLNVIPGAAVSGNGGFAVIGTAKDGSYGINNGIFIDAGTVNMGGDISVSNVTNQGIYIANAGAALTARNITVDAAAGNGIYQNHAEGSLTATGDITISNITGGHGLSTSGTANVVNVTVSNVTGSNRNGLEIKSGSLTATGTIAVNNVTGQGINNAASLSAAAISIHTAGVNGVNNNGGTVNVTGAITATNTAGHGVSNNNVLNAGSVTVTNVTGSGNGIQNSGNGNMTVTGAVTLENIAAGHGIYNAKTVTFGSFTTLNTKRNGINNAGSFTVTGAISITDAGEKGIANTSTLKADSITVKNPGPGYALHSKGGTVEANTIQVTDVASNVGIFLEGNATLKGGTVILDNINNQGIQANHANTIQIGTLFMRNVAKNGLRLYNSSGNPTVSVDTIVGVGIKEYVLAAGKTLTSDNLTVGALYYQNAGNAVHGNVQSGVGSTVDLSALTEDQLAQLKEQLPESIANILFPATSTLEEIDEDPDTGDGTDTGNGTEGQPDTESQPATEPGTESESETESETETESNTENPEGEDNTSPDQGETTEGQEAA